MQRHLRIPVGAAAYIAGCAAAASLLFSASTLVVGFGVSAFAGPILAATTTGNSGK